MKGIIQQSLVEALTPAINTMSVVGLVSIPEFMSGQLASEASPMQANFSFLNSCQISADLTL